MMKYFATFGLVLALHGAAFAEDVQPLPSPFNIGGLPELVASKIMETKAATLITLDATLGGGAYLPVWTFHATNSTDPMFDYLEFGAGGVILAGGNAKAFLCAGLNLPAISRAFWHNSWADAHLRRTVLPGIWIGPYIRAPMPNNPPWVVGHEVGGLLSIRLGGSK